MKGARAGPVTSFAAANPRILLVEDDPADAGLVDAMLASTRRSPEIVHARRLAEATEILAGGERFDAVLLDLNLPDSSGTDTVRGILGATKAPVVVVTVNEALEMAYRALELGAQDYVVKGRFDGDALRRAIEYATIRARFTREIVRRSEDLARELRDLRDLPGRIVMEGPSLRARRPELFRTLVQEFRAGVLDSASGEHQVSAWPHDLAVELASVSANARDVVEIYVAAIDRDLPDDVLEAARAEGRIRALEVMGFLTETYRSRLAAAAGGGT